MKIALIALFGSAGVVSRYFVGEVLSKSFMPALPLGTFAINIVGSFFIGLCAAYSSLRFPISDEFRLAIMVGFLGGFTTFSTYSLDIVKLFQDGRTLTALLYLMVSPIAGCLAVLAGFGCSKLVF